MSILQDLDPQYAKIHTQPSSVWKPIIMAGSALLVLGSGYWVMMQTRANLVSANQPPATHPSQASPIPDEIQKNAAGGSAPTAKQETPDTMTKPPSSSPGATIREEAQRTTSAEERTLKPATIGSPESATGSLADAEYRRQTPVTSSHAKTMPAHGIAKPEHRSVTPQPVAKNEKNQFSGGKRTNERDIDIITAIVR